MSRLRQLHAEKVVLLPLLGGVIAGIICLSAALNRQVVAGSREGAELQVRSMIDANGSTRLQTETPHRYSNSSTADVDR
jgi:hypothetical protein